MPDFAATLNRNQERLNGLLPQLQALKRVPIPMHRLTRHRQDEIARLEARRFGGTARSDGIHLYPLPP